MNRDLWLKLALAGLTALAVIVGYIALRWRRAPKVAKAMYLLTLASGTLGAIVGLSLMGAIRAPSSAPISRRDSGHASEKSATTLPSGWTEAKVDASATSPSVSREWAVSVIGVCISRAGSLPITNNMLNIGAQVGFWTASGNLSTKGS